MKRENFLKAFAIAIGGGILARISKPINVNAMVKDNAVQTYTKEEVNDLIQNAIENIPMQSYVGMFDISSTLNSIEKVKEKYGSDTKWVQHSGYVLRGASSGVVANSNVKTGGNDNAVVVAHSHSVNAFNISGGGHDHGIHYTKGINYDMTSQHGGAKQISNGLPWEGSPSIGNGSHSHTVPAHNTNSKGESGTNKNIPNYKSVYIWERIA